MHFIHRGRRVCGSVHPGAHASREIELKVESPIRLYVCAIPQLSGRAQLGKGNYNVLDGMIICEYLINATALTTHTHAHNS